MTSRAAAMSGLEYFRDVRGIARHAGVELPSDATIAARFSATDSIDVVALTADAGLLDDVLSGLTGAVETAHDVGVALPAVWQGRAADAASDEFAAHVRSVCGAIDQIRGVSRTIAAAAVALTRVQDEKHRALAALRNQSVGGHLIATITAEDIATDSDAVRADITAAVVLFHRTMDVVDASVSTILSALTESFCTLPAAHEVGSSSGGEMRNSGVQGRADMVSTPRVRPDHPRAQMDSDVVVAAISAGATIAGAALAAASTVGTAAASELGHVLNHLIDVSVDVADAPSRRDGTVEATGPIHQSTPTVEHRSETREPSVDSVVGRHVGPDRIPSGPPEVDPVWTPREEHVSPTEPGARSEPVRSHGDLDGVVGDDSRPASPPSVERPADEVAARGIVSSGQRSRAGAVLRARADPEDSGGLALAGGR